MKPVHFVILGLILAEGLFLGLTNFYEKEQLSNLRFEKNRKETWDSRLETALQENSCSNQQAMVVLDAVHFQNIIIHEGYEKKELHLFVHNKELQVGHKELASLPYNFHKIIEEHDLNCVTGLNLTVNHFREIPSVIAEMPYLKTLTLSHNKIKNLNTINGIEGNNIEKLVLSGNPITTIGKEITQFPNLKHLYLRDMQHLTTITEDIKQLKKLKNLVIKGSAIADDHPQVRKLNRWLPNTDIFWYTEK